MNFDLLAQLGDFIAGTLGVVISAGGFYLLYITLKEQRTGFAGQDKKHSIERFESRFLEMISMHRENVSELTLTIRFIRKGDTEWRYKKKKFEKKAVFNAILDQFYTLNLELRKFIKDDSVFKEEYLNELKSNARISALDIHYFSIARIDICYSILYYGVGSEGVKILETTLQSRYKGELVDFVLKYIRLKPKNNPEILDKWRRLQLMEVDERKAQVDEMTKNISEGYTKYYGGHQFRLGHYFRHLYQSVQLVNEFDLIDYKAKYKYAKMLRAQLSTAEQSLLFLSSISALGRSWEFFAASENDRLITKYNLIKNIPGNMTQGFQVARFFPLVEFEGRNESRSNAIYN